MSVQGMFMSWVCVSDLDASIDFYTKVIGLSLEVHDKEHGWAELAAPDGARLGLAIENPHDGMKAGKNAVVCITVDDIEQAKKDYEGSVELVGETMTVANVKLQLMKDRDGNHFHLVEEITS